MLLVQEVETVLTWYKRGHWDQSLLPSFSQTWTGHCAYHPSSHSNSPAKHNPLAWAVSQDMCSESGGNSKFKSVIQVECNGQPTQQDPLCKTLQACSREYQGMTRIPGREEKKRHIPDRGCGVTFSILPNAATTLRVSWGPNSITLRKRLDASSLS